MREPDGVSPVRRRLTAGEAAVQSDALLEPTAGGDKPRPYTATCSNAVTLRDSLLNSTPTRCTATPGARYLSA